MSLERRHSDRRRQFLGRLAGTLGFLAGTLALGSRPARAQDEELPHLPLDDEMAQALMYVEDAEDADPEQREADEFCHNCRYFQAEDEQTEGWAGCQIFPEHFVAAEGWCNVWIEKP